MFREETIKKNVLLLGETQNLVKRRVSRYLRKVGKQALPYLRENVHNPDEHFRSRVLLLIGQFADPGDFDNTFFL